MIRYIVIEREYGSAGTEIGQRTAQACGIPCYGREILEGVAKRQQVSVGALEDYEEQVSGSLLYSLFVMTQSQTGDPDLVSGEGKLYVAETRMIRELAQAGPAIFVGHCAAKALEGEKGLLRVYIHADPQQRQKRAREVYGIPEGEAAAVCRRFDRRRANYYNFCTGQKWADHRSYDLVLDSSALGIDGCVKVLTALMS